MPLYEYKCASCGDVFEVIQKFSDEPLHEHPGCGGAVERLISVSALKFKGSGFYVNDYGKNGSNPDTPKDKPKDKPKSESSDGKNGTANPAAASTKETSTATKEPG